MEEALRRAVGMFALALWDTAERVLTLGRDRIGEKPLYYGWSNGVFLFGSELKALRAHPRWDGTIDREAEALYFQFGYVPSPRSIYKRIGKLPAGSTAILRPVRPAGTGSAPSLAEEILRDPNGRLQTSMSACWSADSIIGGSVSRMQPPTRRRRRNSTGCCGALLDGNCSRMFQVGTLLSGGVDSSVVTAIAQAESGQPGKTFTIAFEDPALRRIQGCSSRLRTIWELTTLPYRFARTRSIHPVSAADLR